MSANRKPLDIPPGTSKLIAEDAKVIIDLLQILGPEPEAWTPQQRQSIMRLAVARTSGQLA